MGSPEDEMKESAPIRPDVALPPRTRGRRLLFALGWLSFAVGIAGVILPILPGTPFMVLALWAFSRSSDRFHAWLYHHRIFGPPLQRWQRERCIRPWTKAVALGSMAASFLYVILWVKPPAWALAAMAAVVTATAALLLIIPSRPRGER
jgi:uncharacterized protein